MARFEESLALATIIPKFKNAKLKAATAALVEVSSDFRAARTEAEEKVEDIRRRVAVILAGLPVDKSGRKLDVDAAEGVKSIPEFMAKIFPDMSPATAYSLAKWGREVVTNDKARPELRAMPYSNYAEVASLEPKALEAALDSGAIAADMTQAALREAKRAIADKPRTVKLYTVRPARPDVDEPLPGEYTVEELPKAIASGFIDSHVYRLYTYELEPADAPKAKLKCIRFCVEFPDASAVLYDAVPKYTPAKTPAQLDAEAADAALIARTMNAKGMSEAEARDFLVDAGILEA